MAGSVKLTKAIIDRMKPGEIAFDGVVMGFGVRYQRRDKVFILRYRFGGRRRWHSIGRFGSPWTVEGARREAIRVLGLVAGGDDPMVAAKHSGITVAELCDQYLAAVPTLLLARRGRAKKPSTIATDRGRIERHVKPLLGRRRVADVTRADIEEFQRLVAAGASKADVKTRKRGRALVRGGRGTASRTVGLLGGIFSFAVRQGMRADNPVRGVQRYADRRVERFLTSAELARFGAALADAERGGEYLFAIAALRFLALTGLRKGEALGLRWRDIDAEAGCLRLPDSKTGARVVVLGAPALALLKTVPHLGGNPYVFAGTLPGHPFVGLPNVWRRVRRAAGLDTLRIHDLRHCFASVGAGGGVGLLMIGKLLGHADTASTARYAHLADDPLRRAADGIAGAVAAAMAGESAAVIPLRRSRGDETR